MSYHENADDELSRRGPTMGRDRLQDDHDVRLILVDMVDNANGANASIARFDAAISNACDRLAASEAESGRLRTALEGVRDALVRIHALASSGPEFLPDIIEAALVGLGASAPRGHDGATGTALDEARRQLDEARVDAARLRALLREVGGIIDEFDAADDSTEELRIIHKLGAWAERALTGTPAAPAPGVVCKTPTGNADAHGQYVQNIGGVLCCMFCRRALASSREGVK